MTKGVPSNHVERNERIYPINLYTGQALSIIIGLGILLALLGLIIGYLVADSWGYAIAITLTIWLAPQIMLFWLCTVKEVVVLGEEGISFKQRQFIPYSQITECKIIVYPGNLLNRNYRLKVQESYFSLFISLPSNDWRAFEGDLVSRLSKAHPKNKEIIFYDEFGT